MMREVFCFEGSFSIMNDVKSKMFPNLPEKLAGLAILTTGFACRFATYK
jgi:hypothetical protein